MCRSSTEVAVGNFIRINTHICKLSFKAVSPSRARRFHPKLSPQSIGHHSCHFQLQAGFGSSVYQKPIFLPFIHFIQAFANDNCPSTSTYEGTSSTPSIGTALASQNMATALPAKLKAAAPDVQRFATRAAQLEKFKPIVSYWCM